MVSVTSASRYITSVSRYHPRYQSRSSMYIRGLIPQNFAEFILCVSLGSPMLEANIKNIKKECNEQLYFFGEV